MKPQPMVFLREQDAMQRAVVPNDRLIHYAHTIAHDLKAPLRGIQHLSHWLYEDNREKLDKDSIDMLQKLILYAQKLTALVNEQLAFASAEAGENCFEIINLQTISQEIGLLLNPTEEVTIVTDCLPTSISYPRAALYHILMNLLSNAIKYNDDPNPVVVVLSKREGDFYWIGVKDNGPGIAQAHHETIFQFLTTLGHTTYRESSTGMGLAFVKKTVEQYGGQVRLRSAPGQGATFWFSIPVWPTA